MGYIKFFAITFALLLVLVGNTALAISWQEDIDQFLLLDGDQESDGINLIKSIELSDLSWLDVRTYLKSIEFDSVETGKLISGTIDCIDDKERPWALYIPSGYDNTQPAPLLIKLHGGVSGSVLPDDPIEAETDSLYIPYAEENGYFVLFPYGEAGATWWDEVGMTNVKNQLLMVKRNYNIDDDRVYMGGFSDGASASFCHAMIAPSEYAAFIALNGHMGVGSLDGDLPTYARNMINTPVYATTTFDDGLYPSKRMRPTIEMALEAGANIHYREFAGEHRLDFSDTEFPMIWSFMDRNPRDPLPSKIIWETADPEYGRCHWFKINQINPVQAKSWHDDHNAVLVDEMIVIGFQLDQEFEGSGIRVASVVEGYAADSLGLVADDVIISAGELVPGDGSSKEYNHMPIVSGDDLGEFKQDLQRGDYLELTVLRDGVEIKLQGQLPEPTGYFLFKRESPSALAKVEVTGNRVKIEGSRLGGFSIDVYPEMFDLSENVVITVNGITVFDALIEPDIRFMVDRFYHERDRKLIPVAGIDVTITE